MANNIKRFCEDNIGTNLLTQVEYDADAQRTEGHQPGKARSKLENKALRQVSYVAAALAQLAADVTADTVDDDNTQTTLVTTLQKLFVSYADKATQCFRLTAVTDTPVTTADVTSSTLYFAPYKGKAIGLYVSGAWTLKTSDQIIFAVPNTANTNYDAFAYDNAGVVTIEPVAWASDTARAVGLTYLDGILVKATDSTRRYVASFRTGSVAGTVVDSATKRFIWNYDNRVVKQFKRVETTASWTYSSATYRQANGNTANRVECLIGLAEDVVSITLGAAAISSNASPARVAAGIGLNSTTADSADIATNGDIPGTSALPLTAHFNNYVPIGYNAFNWLEKGAGAAAQVWYGTDLGNSGLTGRILC